jgi:hypothetical protein
MFSIPKPFQTDNQLELYHFLVNHTMKLSAILLDQQQLIPMVYVDLLQENNIFVNYKELLVLEQNFL